MKNFELDSMRNVFKNIKSNKDNIKIIVFFINFCISYFFYFLLLTFFLKILIFFINFYYFNKFINNCLLGYMS